MQMPDTPKCDMRVEVSRPCKVPEQWLSSSDTESYSCLPARNWGRSPPHTRSRRSVSLHPQYTVRFGKEPVVSLARLTSAQLPNIRFSLRRLS